MEFRSHMGSTHKSATQIKSKDAKSSFWNRRIDTELINRARELTLADSVQSLPFNFVFVGQSHAGAETRLFLFPSLSFLLLNPPVCSGPCENGAPIRLWLQRRAPKTGQNPTQHLQYNTHKHD